MHLAKLKHLNVPKTVYHRTYYWVNSQFTAHDNNNVYFNNHINNYNYNTNKSNMFKCKLKKKTCVTYDTCPDYKVYNYNQK